MRQLRSRAQLINDFGRTLAGGKLAEFIRADPVKLEWKATPQEHAMATKIAERCNAWAMGEGLPPVELLMVAMDILTAHCMDAPLDLPEMYREGDVGAVAQFVAQLGLRIDRRTGRLVDGWRGRFHLNALQKS
jgi:hypothetical protein